MKKQKRCNKRSLREQQTKTPPSLFGYQIWACVERSANDEYGFGCIIYDPAKDKWRQVSYIIRSMKDNKEALSAGLAFALKQIPSKSHIVIYSPITAFTKKLSQETKAPSSKVRFSAPHASLIRAGQKMRFLSFYERGVSLQQPQMKKAALLARQALSDNHTFRHRTPANKSLKARKATLPYYNLYVDGSSYPPRDSQTRMGIGWVAYDPGGQVALTGIESLSHLECSDSVLAEFEAARTGLRSLMDYIGRRKSLIHLHLDCQAVFSSASQGRHPRLRSKNAKDESRQELHKKIVTTSQRLHQLGEKNCTLIISLDNDRREPRLRQAHYLAQRGATL